MESVKLVVTEFLDYMRDRHNAVLTRNGLTRSAAGRSFSIDKRASTCVKSDIPSLPPVGECGKSMLVPLMQRIRFLPDVPA